MDAPECDPSGPAGTDGALGTVAAAIQQINAPALGATNWPLPPALHPTAVPQADETEIVVVGSHMSGLPLNRELTERGGRFLRVAKTAPITGSTNFPADHPSVPVWFATHTVLPSMSKSGPFQQYPSGPSCPVSPVRSASV